MGALVPPILKRSKSRLKEVNCPGHLLPEQPSKLKSLSVTRVLTTEPFRKVLLLLPSKLSLGANVRVLSLWGWPVPFQNSVGRYVKMYWALEDIGGHPNFCKSSAAKQNFL